MFRAGIRRTTEEIAKTPLKQVYQGDRLSRIYLTIGNLPELARAAEQEMTN